MRNGKTITMTDTDLQKLNGLLMALERDHSKDNGFAESLKKEIQRARIVPPKKITGDVVTMNSRVRLKDLGTQENFVFQIVFPSEADLERGKISVLAPVGTALLGYRVGDVITWNVPGGIRKFKIEEMLYQPETEGDFYQ